jgi:hypothetical protein
MTMKVFYIIIWVTEAYVGLVMALKCILTKKWFSQHLHSARGTKC